MSFVKLYFGVRKRCISIKNNNTVKNAVTLSSNNSVVRPVLLGEKIQTTTKGVVRYSEDYKSEYPQAMVEPKKQPLTNNNATKNN